MVVLWQDDSDHYWWLAMVVAGGKDSSPITVTCSQLDVQYYVLEVAPEKVITTEQSYFNTVQHWLQQFNSHQLIIQAETLEILKLLVCFTTTTCHHS